MTTSKGTMRELILRDFEILSELGRGAMGVVYKARQYSLDRIVALKVLAPELARDASYIERFKREAIIAATVTHPNLVTVYEAGAHLDLDSGERLHYFVMEFVEGQTVQQRLAEQQRIPADEVAAIGVRVAEGLQTAWKKARIVHRDVKPGNIFLTRDGNVKIGDLGLARVAGDAQSSLTATGAIIGTAYYMSPEQARGESEIDFRSDIYSLGCALYRMLCGQHPFEGAFASVIVKHLTEPPPSIRMVVPDCPMPIVRVIEKMLAKHPSGRHQSYAELIEDLRQAHEQIVFGRTEEAAKAIVAAPAPGVLTTWVIGSIAAIAAGAGVLWWAPWQSGTGVSPVPERRAGILPVQPVVSPANGQTERPSPAPLPPPAVERTPPPPPPAATTPALPPKPADGTVLAESFLKQAAASPPAEQIALVVAKLKELNPNFDGKETHKSEDGAVTELVLSTVGVTDIAPLKALTWLKRLTLAPTATGQKGALSDLSPLKGMQLVWFYCQNNPIRDLSPLRDMPLTVLGAGSTHVSDLSPLAGKKLTVLSFNDTAVSDLSPLSGMPLAVLWCNNTRVTDFSPLRDMPLRELRCDFVPARDAAILRGIKSLARINDEPAAAFWQRVPAGALGTPATDRTASTPMAGKMPAFPVTPAAQPLMTSIGMELVGIPPGEFMLGSTTEEREWTVNPQNGGMRNLMLFEGERPRKAVIRQGFWLGRTEVTVGQWKQFVNATGHVTDGEKAGVSFAPRDGNVWSSHVEGANWKNPHFGIETQDDHPVCCVSWNDAMAFCAWLNKQERAKGRVPAGCELRLPTEVEWEYACRAGAQTKFWWGDAPEDGDGRLHWCGRWSKRTSVSPKPVDNFGARGRNKFGLADMLGNVCEWCLDGFDPSGAHTELWTGDVTRRVARGGAFGGGSSLARCALRESGNAAHSSAVIGFRVACGPPLAETASKTATDRMR